jgi:hypothetical protein
MLSHIAQLDRSLAANAQYRSLFNSGDYIPHQF